MVLSSEQRSDSEVEVLQETFHVRDISHAHEMIQMQSQWLSFPYRKPYRE